MNNQLCSMTEENGSLTEKTKELERLQSLHKQKRMCPAGWKEFSCSCYLLSERSGSWDSARKDCRDQGGHLVVIYSSDIQNFLATLTQNSAWIGLNDKEEEGTWKWVDGTPLTLTYWAAHQPDDWTAKEDCAHIAEKTEKLKPVKQFAGPELQS
ncbi:C-type lectin domain family 4 member E-like [Archocentrus centrarchus]|uniref:C-type lectin domain family 4 member E-like n=1 Tax=Archocentrus centrarchus TaxID=63155 RepID=UPI0011EA053C|nr:C-type lectin domain family 4 member E-like [Archocentrus centrarchus]